MRTLLALSLVTLLGACSYLPTISADATKAETAINSGVAKADAFVAAKIAPTVNAGNSWLVAALGPYLDTAAHAFFCNKYAQSSCAGT